MKRVSFLIQPEVLERLRVMKARTGVSESEQIRLGIQLWLDSREWPVRTTPQPHREEK